jgi:hypothetical protein
MISGDQKNGLCLYYGASGQYFFKFGVGAISDSRPYRDHYLCSFCPGTRLNCASSGGALADYGGVF